MRRARSTPPPEDWDGGEWVDVGRDGRWSPSAGERIRAIVVLAVVLGVLGALAAALSVDDGDGDDAAATTTTTEATTTTAPTTTEPIDPTSIDGDAPPEPCIYDNRDAQPLRDPADVYVVVRNGTPRGGHAGATSDDLEDAGYRLAEPANASLLQTTRIDYDPGYCAEAFAMTDALGIPGAELYAVEPGSDDAAEPVHLIVTLGRDSL